MICPPRCPRRVSKPGPRQTVVSCTLCVLLATGMPCAQAQSGLDVLRPYLGKPVVVHDVADRQITGVLIDAGAGQVTLAIDGTRRVMDVAEVASVGVIGDSVLDGALKGAVIGALLIAIGGSNAPSCDRPCFRNSALSDALGIGVFGALGAWIDGRKTRERIVYARKTGN